MKGSPRIRGHQLFKIILMLLFVLASLIPSQLALAKGDSDKPGDVESLGLLKKGSITVTKELDDQVTDPDAVFSFTLQGPFTFLDKNPPTTEPITLKQNESYTFGNLSSGAYVLKETSIPSGFVFKYFDEGVNNPVDHSSAFVIFNGNNICTKAVNHKLRVLKFTKLVDNMESTTASFHFVLEMKVKDCWVPVPFGCFDLKGGESKIFYEPCDGKYRLIELPVCDPYQFVGINGSSKNPYEFDVNCKDLLTQITVTNHALGRISIAKTDSQTKDAIEGVILHASRDAFATHIVLTTGADGTVTSDYLEPGQWQVKEISAPAGYAFDPEKVWNVDVPATGTGHLDITNTPQGTIRIYKDDSATDLPIGGVVFEVSLDDSFDSEVSEVFEMTTQSNGIALTSVLPGTYYIREKSAPAGYVMDNTIGMVNIKRGETGSYTFHNTPEGTLRITKTDADTGKAIEGVVFELSKDPTFNPEGTILTLTTNAEGIAENTHLVPGDYYVRETSAPAGYVFDKTAAKVTIELGKITNLTRQNTPQGTLRIVKADSDTGNPIKDVVFQLSKQQNFSSGIITLTTNAEGIAEDATLVPGTYYLRETSAPAGYTYSTDVVTVDIALGKTTQIARTNTPHCELILRKVNANDTAKTLAGAQFRLDRLDSDNQIDKTLTVTIGSDGTLNNDLLPGKWVVTEIAAPTGYILDATSQTVTLAIHESKTLSFANKPTEINLIKKDRESNTVLPGAVFNIFNAQNVKIGAYTTDANGKIYLAALPAGNYTAVETTAPAGYRLLTAAVPITVAAGVNADVIILDDLIKGSLKIIKIDGDTNTKLAGAVFDLYSDEALTKRVAKDLTTDANGTVLCGSYVPGFYWVVETKPPTGYEPMAKLKVEIKADIENVVTIKNIFTDHPTATNDQNMLMGGGALLLAGGSCLLVYRIRRKHKALSR